MSNYKDDLKDAAKNWAIKAAFRVVTDWLKHMYENFKDRNYKRDEKEESPEDRKKQRELDKKKEETIMDHITIPCEPQKITWIPSPHISSRKGTEIAAIIIHHTGDSIESAISWMKMKESKVSYHYLIAKNGDIYQMVKEEDKAWHAGVSVLHNRKNVNTFSIGIAFEGKGVGSVPYTDEQYKAGAYLCKLLKRKYTKITNGWIVGHKTIAPERKPDPSNFDWARFYGLIG